MKRVYSGGGSNCSVVSQSMKREFHSFSHFAVSSGAHYVDMQAQFIIDDLPFIFLCSKLRHSTCESSQSLRLCPRDGDLARR